MTITESPYNQGFVSSPDDRRDSYIVDVSRCQRCGRDHKQMAFWPLTNPADEWKWFGICPVVSQPVLLHVDEEDAPQQETPEDQS